MFINCFIPVRSADYRPYMVNHTELVRSWHGSSFESCESEIRDSDDFKGLIFILHIKVEISEEKAQEVLYAALIDDVVEIEDKDILSTEVVETREITII